MTILRAAPQHRSDARVAEGGALLRRYTGLNRYRGFESLSLRQTARQPVFVRSSPATRVARRTRTALVRRRTYVRCRTRRFGRLAKPGDGRGGWNLTGDLRVP